MPRLREPFVAVSGLFMQTRSTLPPESTRFMQKLILSSLLAGFLMLPLGHAVSAESVEIESGMLSVEAARAKLLQARPNLPIDDISLSNLPGFFEVVLQGGMILYMDGQADFFIAGDLFFVRSSGLVNATELARTDKRRQLLEALDEDDMVVFAPKEREIKATITVFTDIDCGYCRKLHQEVPELNDLGVSVRYLAYPRAGVGSASYDKIVSAWCADNPKVALTLAKAGQEISPKTCENPVASHYSMGGDFGVSGTPAIIYEDGTLQPGYLPAAQLAQRLGIN